MRSTLSTVVALASSLQVASATYSWNNAPAFSCPANTNNHCNSQQSSGFDWSGLSFGSFSTYGSFDFSGFTCASSFGGGSKRDLLSGRGFQSTCITGTTHSDASSCPSFGCGSSSEVSAFSVSEIEISVEFDCSLEFHYSMPGGTTCKQTSSCSAGGSVVKNSQCGGATSVTVVYPSQTSGSGKTKTSCSIGVHSIGFDCSSASSTQYHSTATSSPTKPTTSPAQTTSSTTPVHTSSSSPVQATSTSSPVQVSSSSSPAATTFSTYVVQTTSTSAQVTVSSPGATTSSTLIAGTTSSTLIGGTTSSTLNAATTSSTLIAATTSSSAQEVVSSPTSTSVVDVVTTVVVDTTTTLCPVTLTHTNGNGISLQVSTSTSTLFLTTTKTVCTRCEAQSTSSPIATSAPAGVQSSSAVYVPTTVITSSGPITTATCPDVLPQCLNTWLFIEGCSSNADTACFCPSSDFVSNVFSCLSAYGASDTEISSAQTYFQGICAPYIPSNPALVTCASSVTATVTQSYPVTTITVSQIITVPCTQTTGVSAGYTIASSFTTTVLSTQVTVPQVVFTTVGTTSGGAVLITGAPTIGNAGVAAPTVVPTYSTLAVTTTSNGTTKATSTPTQVFSGSAGKNNIAIGASLFAVLFAVLIL